MLYSFLLRIILLGLALQASISAASSAIPYHQWTLKNGLEVILLPNDSVPAVNHTLFFKVGAMDDPDGKTGLAHYLEHMLFQGAENSEPGAYHALVTKLGGDTNAFTSADYTGYYVTIQTEHLPQIMALEASRLAQFNPPADEFIREREVIKEERASRVDSQPAALLGLQMDAALYAPHPYARPIIGTKPDIAALDEAAARAHLARYYRPDNALLVVSGDIAPERLRTLTERHYGSWIKAEAPLARATYPDAASITPQTITLRDARVQQRRYQRSVRLPNLKQAGDLDAQLQQLASWSVLDYLLSADRTGYLYKRLIRDAAIASEVGSYHQGLRRGPSEWSISLIPRDGVDAPTVTAALNATLRDFAASSIDPDAIARAKTLQRADLVYARDGLEPLAMLIGRLALLDLPPESLSLWEAALARVTAEDITAVAQQLIGSEQVLHGWLLPEGDAS